MTTIVTMSLYLLIGDSIYLIELIILSSRSNFTNIRIRLTSPKDNAATTPAACNNLSLSLSNPGVSIISNSPIIAWPTTTYFVTDGPPEISGSFEDVIQLKNAVFPDPIAPN